MKIIVSVTIMLEKLIVKMNIVDMDIQMKKQTTHPTGMDLTIVMMKMH